jgi:hypothetical protein
MVVESFRRERGYLLILLAVKNEQFAIVIFSKVAKIGGIGLDVKWV